MFCFLGKIQDVVPSLRLFGKLFVKPNFIALLSLHLVVGCVLLLEVGATPCQASTQKVTPIYWWTANIGNTGPGPYGSMLDPGGNCESCLQASGGFHWNGVLTPLGYGAYYETNFPFYRVKGCQFIQRDGSIQDNGCVVERGAYCPVSYQVDGDNCSYIGQQNPLKNNGVPAFCPTGNPINHGNGNKFQVETDYVGIASPALKIERFYNSSVVMLGAELGANWRTNYDRTISLSSTLSLTTATAYRLDGKAYFFTQIGGIWTPDSDITATLTELKDASGARTGWRYTTSHDSVETYDASGKLLSITARNGLTQTLTYSDGTSGVNGGYILDASGSPTTMTLPAGLMLRVTDATGRALTFGYDISSRIVKMLDPAGGVYHYAYDPNNNLSSVTYPDGKTKTYLYGEAAYTSGATLPHALTGIIDENGVRYATYRYDSTGRAYDEDHGGSVDHYNLAYSTDTSGNPVSTVVTDPLGTARTYNFTTVLGVVKSTGTNQPGGSGCGAASSGVTYDANGNVASRTDFNGNVTTYAYDIVNRPGFRGGCLV